MKFRSTRSQNETKTLSEALTLGMANDGGLFMPEHLPSFDVSRFSQLDQLSDVAYKVLTPFFKNDPLEAELKQITTEAFNFSVPLKYLKNNSAVLELFHGPTCAFKDVGARFLANCASRLKKNNDIETVLVATSGDTGGAVAAAFYKKPNIEVIILYPKGRISQRQEKQLTAWGENIKAYAVRGTFDDCQALVKKAFSSPTLKNKKFISANSINIGRLLPQTTYYAKASLEYFQKYDTSPGVIVPSGNLGNAVAAVMAMQMGFPIREIVLATNANHTINDYFKSNVWAPTPTIATLANAMDVGSPNNFERLLYLFGGDIEKIKHKISTVLVSDAEISETIKNGLKNWGEIWCPHTATAVKAREVKGGEHWIMVATAHPAKFETIVEPLIGQLVEVPATLKYLLHKTARFDEVEPNFESFEEKLLKIK